MRVRAMSGVRSLQEMVSVAPMMDYTDVHFRALCRIVSRRATLYTEMLVDKAVVNAEKEGRVAKMLASLLFTLSYIGCFANGGLSRSG